MYFNSLVPGSPSCAIIRHLTLVQLLCRRRESLGQRPCIPGTPPTNSGLFSSSDTKLTTLDSWTTRSAPSTERAPVIPSLTRLMECHWLSQRELGGRYSTTVGAAPLSKTSLTYIVQQQGEEDVGCHARGMDRLLSLLTTPSTSSNTRWSGWIELAV